MFLQVSVCPQGCMHGRGGMHVGGMRGSGGDMHGRGGVHGRYYGTRSMSGQYASYWNAFLLMLVFLY